MSLCFIATLHRDNTVDADWLDRTRVGGGMRPSFVPRSADDSAEDPSMDPVD